MCLCRQTVYITLCNNKYVNGVLSIRAYFTVLSVELIHSLLTVEQRCLEFLELSCSNHNSGYVYFNY